MLVTVAALLAVFAVGCEGLDSLNQAPGWFVTWFVLGCLVLLWKVDSSGEQVTAAIDGLKEELKGEIAELATKVSELEDGLSPDLLDDD